MAADAVCVAVGAGGTSGVWAISGCPWADWKSCSDVVAAAAEASAAWDIAWIGQATGTPSGPLRECNFYVDVNVFTGFVTVLLIAKQVKALLS